MRESYAERCARKRRDKKGESFLKVLVALYVVFAIVMVLTNAGKLDWFINWILETKCTEAEQTVYGMGGENLCE